MCLMCIQTNIFSGRNPTNLELARARAKEIKSLLASVDTEATCHIGDGAIELLKKEQYELAKRL